ncbi:MAG TPA: ABC-2 transporter permease [Bacillales bacterium]
MAKLIRKDWHLLARPVTLYIFLMDCFLFELAFWEEAAYISIITLVFVIQFVMLIASYEEKYNSHKLVGSLPATRRQVVLAKYVDGLVFALIGYLLALALALPTSLIRTGDLLQVSNFDLIGTMGAALLMLGVFYPIFYKFNKWFPAFMAAVLLEMAFFRFIPEVWLGSGDGWVFAVCFLLYGVSYYISLEFYQKKDL